MEPDFRKRIYTGFVANSLGICSRKCPLPVANIPLLWYINHNAVVKGNKIEQTKY